MVTWIVIVEPLERIVVLSDRAFGNEGNPRCKRHGYESHYRQTPFTCTPSRAVLGRCSVSNLGRFPTRSALTRSLQLAPAFANLFELDALEVDASRELRPPRGANGARRPGRAFPTPGSHITS
ncbi:MAG TPA: hypothetical protein VLK65_21390 [Vicinamibacteria bacterium]|nr:hypothetical protein [Vicinamibacteria bacterium]